MIRKLRYIEWLQEAQKNQQIEKWRLDEAIQLRKWFGINDFTNKRKYSKYCK